MGVNEESLEATEEGCGGEELIGLGAVEDDLAGTVKDDGVAALEVDLGGMDDVGGLDLIEEDGDTEGGITAPPDL